MINVKAITDAPIKASVKRTDTAHAAAGNNTIITEGRSPYISDGMTWVVWDTSINSWRDTGIRAEGQPGKDGKDGAPGRDGADGLPGEKGEKGDPGDGYILTEADRKEIAGKIDLSAYAKNADLKTVAKTGSYNDLSNKPTIISRANDITPTQTAGSIPFATIPFVDWARADRLAFLPADQIVILKTVDGGQTWTDAEVGDIDKRSLFSGLRNSSVKLPTINGKKNELCGLRIYITASKFNVPDGTAEEDKINYWDSDHVKASERYTGLLWLFLWVSAIGAKMHFRITKRKGLAGSAWEKVYDSRDNGMGLTGWSGSNSVYFPTGDTNFGGGRLQTGNTWSFCFEFMTYAPNGFNPTYANIAQEIISIQGYSSRAWTYPNNLMKFDHLYEWDLNQNALFPAKVTATELQIGNTSISEAQLKKLLTLI